MDVISEHTLQIQLDLETDTARLARLEWQRALDRNLHALQDYVNPGVMLIWQPGTIKRRDQPGTERGALQVELATGDTCTCSRYRLKARCEHIAFARTLASAGQLPDTTTPIAARSLEVSR